MLDTNGNGKRDAYVEGEQKVATAPSGESLGTSSAFNAAADPSKDTRLNAAFYGVAVGRDGMVWGSVLGFPGGIVRLNPGKPPRNGSGGVLRGAVERSQGTGVGLFTTGYGY